MKRKDITDIKHLRQLKEYAENRLGLRNVRAIRCGNCAKIEGEFWHNETAYAVEAKASLRGGNFVAQTNSQSDLVRAVNAIRSSLNLPIISGVSQTTKSERPKPTRSQPSRARTTLHLNLSEKDNQPTRLDADPFAALAPFATPRTIPDDAILWILQGEQWVKDSVFTNPDGVERRAMALLRSGRAVKIQYP